MDSDGKSLAGATFKLMSVDADGKEVQITTSGKGGSYKYDKSGTAQTLDTDKDGVLSVTGLPCGSYRVYEVKAPEGYNLVNIPREFVITRQGQVAEYDFENSLIKANIRFIKVDDKDEPLQGVSFTLFKLIDGEYKSQTTVSSDDKGIVSVEGLGAGTYYFKENALTGYNADTEKMYGFTITEANNGQTLTLPGIEKKVNGLHRVHITLFCSRRFRHGAFKLCKRILVKWRFTFIDHFLGRFKKILKHSVLFIHFTCRFIEFRYLFVV